MLDVGCGSGGFCNVAATAGANVCGIDADEQALATARARVPAADLRVGRMEALPWDDASFDVVVGINAFQYAQNPSAALSEAARVALPGGVVAICKWGAPQDNELFTILGALTGEPQPASSDAFAALRPALRAARLEPQTEGGVPVVLELPDAHALHAAVLGAGATASPGEVRAAAAPFVQSDGSYRLANVYRYLLVTPAARA